MDNFFTQPPTYENVKLHIHKYKQKYGKSIKLFSIGRSVTGRKIYALGIGCLKKANLITAATHGQEWLTTLVVLKYFEELCGAIQKKTPFCNVQIENVFYSRGLIIVPLVNPDGVEIALKGPKGARHLCRQVERMQKRSLQTWQANARGIDLNHNFDAGFKILKKLEKEKGITKPGPRGFGGIKPHSEPESYALVSLCRGFQIHKVIALHSQGEEIYYDYGDNTPKNARLLADALAMPCGYKVCRPTGTASHGGFKDWFIKETKQCGFTIEIGKGENPLPITDLIPIYQKLKETLFIASIF